MMTSHPSTTEANKLNKLKAPPLMEGNAVTQDEMAIEGRDWE